MSRTPKHPRTDLSLVPQLEWIRLAAFIDGEGSISIGYSVHKDPKFEGSREKYEYVRLDIANTDPRLMEWLVRVFGGSVRGAGHKRKSPAWKPAFWWTVSCTRATDILRGCLPYFIMKRDRAELAIALQATMTRSGRRGTPDHVIAERTEIKTTLHALNARGPLTRVG